MKKEDAIGMSIGLTILAGTAVFAAKEFLNQEKEAKQLSSKDLVNPFWRNTIKDILDKLNRQN